MITLSKSPSLISSTTTRGSLAHAFKTNEHYTKFGILDPIKVFCIIEPIIFSKRSGKFLECIFSNIYTIDGFFTI